MTTFTTVQKTQNHKWQAPAQVSVTTDYFLNIGSGYNLLLNATNKLVIQPGQAGTTWTNTSKGYVARI